MTRVPYNIDEARNICKGLQYLIGRDFSPSDPNAGAIEAVIVTPFDQQSKKIFFTTFLLTEDADLCLSQYRGLLYDVEVLARDTNDHNDLLHCDVEGWMQKNGLNWDDVCGKMQNQSRWQSC